MLRGYALAVRARMRTAISVQKVVKIGDDSAEVVELA
jgi:hypothetical protein